jgi:hypothetical protein
MYGRYEGGVDANPFIWGQGSAPGNANVYVSENPDNTITLNVRLAKSASPYEIAGAMANLTYGRCLLRD